MSCCTDLNFPVNIFTNMHEWRHFLPHTHADLILPCTWAGLRWGGKRDFTPEKTSWCLRWWGSKGTMEPFNALFILGFYENRHLGFVPICALLPTLALSGVGGHLRTGGGRLRSRVWSEPDFSCPDFFSHIERYCKGDPWGSSMWRYITTTPKETTPGTPATWLWGSCLANAHTL